MSLSIGKINQNKMAQLELRKQLLGCLKQQKDALRKILDDFYDLPRRTEEDYAQVNQKIIEILSRIIEAGDWNSSLFLRNAIKSTKEQIKVAEMVKEELESKGIISEQEFPPISAEESVELYVLLYQVDGTNLQKWESQLESIIKVSQGRPIYSSEEQVLQMLRSKLNRSTDAYIKILVDKKDIIDSARLLKDSLGNELITVSVTAIRPENIIKFVYQNKEYKFINNTLRLKK